MMKMYNFAVVVVLTLVYSTSGQQCDIKDDNGNPLQWNHLTIQSLGEFFKNVPDGTEVPGVQLNGVAYVRIDTNDCESFLDIKADSSHVTVLAKNFKNWDTSGNSNGVCKMTLVFSAEDCGFQPPSEFLKFSYTVKDVNTMPPKFNEDSYTLNVPFPLPPGLDITGALGVLIQTTDTDFSTKNIVYTLSGEDADYFEGKLSGSANRVFPMSLKTKKMVNKQNTVRLTVTATDDGEPSLSSTAEIIIIPNLENSIPPVPEFTQSLKTEKIDPSTLKTGEEVTQIELKEEYDGVKISVAPDTFKAVLEKNIVHISLTNDLEVDKTPFITIEVHSELNNGFNTASSSTVVILEFLEEATSTTTETTVTTTESTTGTDSESTTTSSTGTDTETTTPPTTTSTGDDSTSTGSTGTGTVETTTPPTTTPTGDDTTTPDSTGTGTETTTPTTTTLTDNESTTTSSTGTDLETMPTTPTGHASTSSTVPGTETIPTTTTPSSPGPTPPAPPQEEPKDPDSGLLAATIVLSISTAVLLVLNAYGCYKYIYLPRKAKKIAIA